MSRLRIEEEATAVYNVIAEREEINKPDFVLCVSTVERSRAGLGSRLEKKKTHECRDRIFNDGRLNIEQEHQQHLVYTIRSNLLLLYPNERQIVAVHIPAETRERERSRRRRRIINCEG